MGKGQNALENAQRRKFIGMTRQRLECIAFGYPVPHYNWTRVGADLPRGSYITNHNRKITSVHLNHEQQGRDVTSAIRNAEFTK